MDGVSVKMEPQDTQIELQNIKIEPQDIKIEPQDIKMEPQDIKIEPGLDSCSPSKKKKSAGKPKKLKQVKITDHVTVVKKKRDRFNGMSEEEVSARLLPDHLAPDLDIVIVGINPGLFAAYIGHHYAGPGNHFWKCMYLSGLIPEPMNAMQDYKLLDYGIGFTNIVARTTKGSADLTRKEIKEGAGMLTEKLLKYKPKIAVFNGKGIYEVFVGHKNFYFGKQPEPLPGTETAVFVMPSSSARCSQLPRAVDKVPFYEALKKFRDHLNGKLPNLDDSEVCFPDLELKTAKKEPKTEGYDEGLSSQEMEAQINQAADSLLAEFTQGNYQIIPHATSGDLPSLQISGPQIKQEPKDYDSGNLSQCSNSLSQASNTEKSTVKVTKKRGRPRKEKTALKQSSSLSSLQGAPYSNNSTSFGRSMSLNSLSNHSGQAEQSQNFPSIKQEIHDHFQPVTSQCLPEGSSESSSQLYCVPAIKQEPQDIDYSRMPQLQQFPKIKQESEEFRTTSCSVSQSQMSPYLPYLNMDQSEHLSHTNNQSNSFLQGLYGMVDKVANQQQSNYGMVSLNNQTSICNQSLQFNDALCDIVKESGYDMEEPNVPIIKTEPGTENIEKPKQTRKRKSNSKTSSTVTSAEANEKNLNSPLNVPPVTTSETHLPQSFHSIPNSGHTNHFANHPNSHENYYSQNFSQPPNGMVAKHHYPQYTGQIPVTNNQNYTNGFNHSFHQFQQSVNFSQMLNQDDSFMKYYGKGYPQPQVPGQFPGMTPGFSPYSYPYGQAEFRQAAVSQSQDSTSQLSSDIGASLQASYNTAFDLRLRPEGLRAHQSQQQQASQDQGSGQTQASERQGPEQMQASQELTNSEKEARGVTKQLD